MDKKPFGLIGRRALLSGIAASSLAAALLPRAAFAQATPTQGGTLNFLVNPEPPAIVSLTTTDGGAVQVSPKITEGLLSYDLDFNPLPQLATEWSISEDGKTYTFKLREGVKWHDGEDFTSADVKRSIELLREVHDRGKTTFKNVTEIQTPDAHTAIIVLSDPAPYLLSAFAAFESPIVPAHLYEEGGDPRTNPNRLAPIGTGPFKFGGWEQGSHIVLLRNEDYWDAPRPYLDQIVVRFIPDSAARSIALETGEVDIAGNGPVAVTDIDRLANLPHLDISEAGYGYIPQPIQIQFNLDNQYFKHLEVRQAVAHTIDRQFIIDNILAGYGVPNASPLSPFNKPFYTDKVESYPPDTAKAEELLDRAGFPRGANGVRFEVPYDYANNRPERKPIAEYLKSVLAGIGIEVTLRAGDGAAITKRVNTDRDFAFAAAQLAQMFDPSIGVPRAYVTRTTPDGVFTNNASNYSNPEVDQLLTDAGVETDLAKRIELFRKAQEIIAYELPILNLISIVNTTVFNTRVHDHSITYDGIRSNWANVYVDAA